MTRTVPTTIEIDMQKLDDVLRRVAANELTEDDCQTIRTLFASYVHLTELLKDKNTSLARLRKMLFGARTEKTAAVIGGKDSPSPSSQETSSATEATAEAGVESASAGTAAKPWSARESGGKTPRKNHGRNGADAYAAAEKIVVPHESLQPGDPCPKCETGTVYETGRPGVLVRLVGQAPIQAAIYELQKLRCNLCGVVFTAQSPEGVGAEKYDATAGSMIAVLKYGTGMPFHRLDALQDNLGIPLPASTQWEIVHAQARRIEPVFDELIGQAAQGDVLYNDDTTVKILELMGERAKEQALAEEAADHAAGAGAAQKPESERKGMFTSGIVSSKDGRKIALFFSGRQHAGENLAEVLAERAKASAAPIQMCDALSRNLPGELKTILAHCLAHGRRKFVEVAEHFPEECRHVLEALAVIYRNDAIAKEQNFSPEKRLLFHQAESGPVMEELRVWLVRQFDQRRVEPNSSLGGAISYLLKHWERLTLFLRVAGAPLDNNVCERALKRAILHRKNALFYKTCRGARVGDLFMSLIHTCQLCGASPFDYLTALQRHAGELSANPARWMPWNYRDTLAATPSSLAATP
jgi:transposase